ncbi:MAG: methyltransferase domain-containing protein [Lactococcus chungangensis]|jgi:ubiquinone/menaquinone biosynthesis C-methylase UbiE
MNKDSYNTKTFTTDMFKTEKERLSKSIKIQENELLNCFKLLEISEDEIILDLGCGTGEISFLLALLNPNCSIIGIDRENEFILDNYTKYEEQKNISFLSGDCYSIPLADSSVDVCFSRYLFQHLRNPELALKEIYRVLKPGGKIGIFDIDKGLDIIFPFPNNYQKFNQAEKIIKKMIKNDICIGRKLYTLLHNSNFTNINVSDVSINSLYTDRKDLVKLIKLWEKQGKNGHLYSSTKRITEQEIKDYFISLINIAESDNSYINFGNLFIHGIKNFI